MDEGRRGGLGWGGVETCCKFLDELQYIFTNFDKPTEADGKRRKDI